VWEERSEIALFISSLGSFLKMAGAEMGHSGNQISFDPLEK
jgi:hypothetical protein